MCIDQLLFFLNKLYALLCSPLRYFHCSADWDIKHTVMLVSSMLLNAQNIQRQMVQWLVCNAFEGISTEPVMVKYLIQYPHLSAWS
jgi:hypothetical protein